MQRSILLWTLVAFFGASIVFRAIIQNTKDSPILVTIALELVAVAVLIGVIVLLVRRSER